MKLPCRTTAKSQKCNGRILWEDAKIGIKLSAEATNAGGSADNLEIAGICYVPEGTRAGGMRMDTPNKEFVLVGSLEELKAAGRLDVQGRHRPILIIYDRGRVFALDNRCPPWASRSRAVASRT